jgi:hypothetical protein
MTKNKAVFGIVRTQSEAEALIEALRSEQFALDDISVLFPNKGQSRDFAVALGTKAPEGAIIGAGSGGALGGALGLLAGVGLLAVPGLGALIAAGPIMALLSGAAVGAAVGSMTGALVGLGIPEIQAKAYEGKIQGGNILVAVHTEDPRDVVLAKEVFDDLGAQDIAVTSEAAVPAAAKPPEARRIA